MYLYGYINRAPIQRLDLRHLQRGRQTLLELVSLVGVLHAERVQVAGAPHLELGGSVRRLLDFHRASVLAARRQQEFLDLLDSLRLQVVKEFASEGESEETRDATTTTTATATATPAGKQARRARRSAVPRSTRPPAVENVLRQTDKFLMPSLCRSRAVSGQTRALRSRV